MHRASWSEKCFNGQQGAIPAVAKDLRLYISPWENYPTSHLIYFLSSRFLNEFMVSVNSFESSSIHNEVRWVNYGPIYGKIDYKVGHVWGRGYLVIDKAPPWRVHQFSVRLNPKILHSSELPETCILSNGLHWLQLNVSLWKKSPNFFFSQHFPNEFMVSIYSFKSLLIKHGVHFVNYAPI